MNVNTRGGEKSYFLQRVESQVFDFKFKCFNIFITSSLSLETEIKTRHNLTIKGSYLKAILY
uniref:Uncharacterized protein n=1 Tax=Lepeophtheirus salmonis TaxID=72036 RepID=A0A0K2T6E6_LEPSM